MTSRKAMVATITSAAVLAGAAPILGQTHPGGGTATEHAVAINDAGYAPGEVVVAPGHHVVWTNGGVNPHTVTADGGAFDSGILQARGKFDLTAPATTGTFPYHCTLHTFMRGTLVVSTLSLEGPRLVIVGKTASVHGAAPGTVAGTPVAVESYATGAWTQIAATTIAADGTFQVRTPALTKGAALRARIGADISPTLNVPVAPRVTAKRAGKRTLAVTVRPARAGRARLERLNVDRFRWAVVRQLRIGGNGRATVTVPKAGAFRVTVLAAKGLAAASSPALRFR
jgi:plastocyanin